MKFIINGGKHLSGEISVRGFKNSATPIIAATILNSGVSVLANIPKIGDVLTMLDILRSGGSKYKWINEDEVRIDNSDFDPEKIDQILVKKIRSSVLLIGPILAKYKKISISVPGGCHIGARPLDTHLEAFKELGAEVIFDEKSGIYNISLKEIKKHRVVLKEISVTATENLVMFAASNDLEIRLAACEPHVVDLCNFLKKSGVSIEGVGTNFLKIKKRANSDIAEVTHRIINDPIEAGTFAALAAATKSNILIKNCDLDFLDAPLMKLKDFGVCFEANDESIYVNGKSSFLKASKIQTLPYPGFPTDLQAPFGVLATQATGSSLIFDIMYEGRLKYINELKKMGADATILDPHRAIINGPSVLEGAEIESLDLRAGATVVIAALLAKGKSIIDGIEQIDRGYERLDERLLKLGADIKRID
ncbi:MAG: UDP-N-acetylglucosamine 1-carboxyvinyltransferase [Patescibacteria group bacterium]|nr:UDP-N-acetylglucosamine 1-carboxyvinyltransferase [Patescibacteria group bacterium]